jgi:hypothetical protein
MVREKSGDAASFDGRGDGATKLFTPGVARVNRARIEDPCRRKVKEILKRVIAMILCFARSTGSSIFGCVDK